MKILKSLSVLCGLFGWKVEKQGCVKIEAVMV